MSSIPLYLSNHKVIGEIIGSTAYLPVTSKNYLAVGGGYSVDDRALGMIVGAGCELIDFWHKKTGKHFRVRVDRFRDHAKAFDYGYGTKWAAPIDVYEPELGQEA